MHTPWRPGTNPHQVVLMVTLDRATTRGAFSEEGQETRVHSLNVVCWGVGQPSGC